ncbi:MAG TPA: hypothetical protein VFU83_05765 [Pyrinomonadaceae bacterium]|nr:hypothetical protein [Pyrinomonadaceae bacterium]
MYYLFFLSFLLAFAQALQPPNCGCEDNPQINVLAVVNGIKITKQDLSIDTKTQVSLAQDEVMTARSRALNLMINDKLLEAEAKRRGLTSAKLLELEVIAKIVKPTEDEARAVYENKQITEDFKRVKSTIITQLRTEREAIRIVQFANALRVGAQVDVSDQPVTPPTTEAELDRVFATVNGVNITSRDIENNLLPLIFNVQKRVYALRKQDVDLRINDLLLEQEAKRLGTTPRALIYQNVRTPIITDKEAREFHKQNKATLPGDYEDQKDQIMRLMMAQALQKQVQAYAEQLRKGAAVQIYLTAPEPPNLRQLCCNPVD